MTLQDAWKTDRQLVLTIQRTDGTQYTDTMIRPYAIFNDGSVYGEMRDGRDACIRPEDILAVEVGEEIR